MRHTDVLRAFQSDAADNVDLDRIVQEFEWSYESKFGRKVKLVSRVASEVCTHVPHSWHSPVTRDVMLYNLSGAAAGDQECCGGHDQAPRQQNPCIKRSNPSHLWVGKVCSGRQAYYCQQSHCTQYCHTQENTVVKYRATVDAISGIVVSSLECQQS
jgi:hypothetical protein